MGKCYRQLQWKDRVNLEVLLRAGHSKSEIARLLHVHRSTIYNELKRGQYIHRNSDWTEEVRYSPEIAQKKYEDNLAIRGTQLKIGNDIEFANYIEAKIADENYSPDAVLGELKAQGRASDFSVTICTSTLYSYIDKGIFLRLSNQNLPVKRAKKKRKYNHVNRQKRASAGESIDYRSKDINTREEFGHWEMDTVVGSRGKAKHSLLVLTERKTRYELIFLLKEHTASEVVRSVDRLERKWGKMFSQVFKTITVDNGSEFAYCAELETSVFGKKRKRTKVYYCHPYSSYERGSNENANKLVRRHIPKGINFDDMSPKDILNIEKWINHYPRRLLGYHSADELFNDDLEKLA